MKFAIVLFSLAANILAQSGTMTSAPAAASATLSPALSCLNDCKASDVTCQAACLGNARPNASQVNETTECAAKCDQGNGSAEATEKYAKCQQSCISSFFPSSQTAFIVAAGAASSSAAGAIASATSASRSAAASRTTILASGVSAVSGSVTQASGSAAANANSVKLIGAGLAGLMAMIAL